MTEPHRLNPGLMPVLKRLGEVLAILLVVFALAGCSDDETPSKKSALAPAYSSSDTWLVYLYVCGSDLETNFGAASADLDELSKVRLPENVRVIVQTGGSRKWQTNDVPSNRLGRFLYDSQGKHLLDTAPDANMGNVNTLKDFLQYGKDNFQADHRVFVFWDHGGGSVQGLCADEKYQTTLSLNDVHNAFASVFGTNEAEPPFELIGFDACLMATIDSAASLHGIAHYMVGSEEIEPGLGWCYDKWVGALADNPGMGGEEMGRKICDSYLKACLDDSVGDTATLSVTDLSKLPDLLAAYDAFGREALRQAQQNPRSFFTTLARRAESSESYGGNTREQGYTNMVDLGHLAAALTSDMPGSTPSLRSAIQKAVVYEVHGPYRPNSSGLSSYYAFDGKAETWHQYAALDAPPLSIKCLYYYLLFGQMPAEAQPLLAGEPLPQVPTTPATPSAPGTSGGNSIADALLGNTSAPAAGAHPVFSIRELENTIVDIDNEGAAFVHLTPQQLDMVSAVHCEFFYIGEKEDVILYLGSDADINADWQTGVFKDNFFGRWPMFDGHPIYIEITYEGDEKENYNRYSVPIKLNGVESNLQVIYSFKDKAYKILGAWRGIDSYGMSDRDLVKLKPGDVITTLHYGMTISGSDTDFTQVEVDTFVYGSNSRIEDMDVGDGKYGYYFEFVNPLNEIAWSNRVTYTITNGQIVTSVGDDLPSGTGTGSYTTNTSYSTPPPPSGMSIADQMLR